MSDHADIADEKIYRAIAAGLEATRRSSELVSDCFCHFCEEAIPVGSLFCDVDCRDDFEREQAALRRAGR